MLQAQPVERLGLPVVTFVIGVFLGLCTGQANHSLQEQPMRSDMRFTQAQKRDLLRMSGAAVVSTIFFGVPMFLGRPDAARVGMPPAQIESAQVQPAPAEPAKALPAAELQDSQVAVVFSEAVAQVTVPTLARSSTAFAQPARATRSARPNATAVTASQRAHVAPSTGKTLSRLGRLLAGTGRYEVRPFPTVGTSGG